MSDLEASKARAKIQEALLRLYLRLNGFFYTGFIAHSPYDGRVRTEIDALAVRFPEHAEPERVVIDDPSLELSNHDIEFLICEVKSRGQALQFNPALHESSEAAASILRRLGCFSPEEVQSLVPAVQQALIPQREPKRIIRFVHSPEILEARRFRIRGLLFSPERESVRSNQPWYVGADMVFPFISSCLSPEVPRATCAVNYGAGQWAELTPLVEYFKKKPVSELGSMEKIYQALGC
jgi:hypothetical protein